MFSRNFKLLKTKSFESHNTLEDEDYEKEQVLCLALLPWGT